MFSFEIIVGELVAKSPYKGHLDVARLLCQAGADKDRADQDGDALIGENTLQSLKCQGLFHQHGQKLFV